MKNFWGQDISVGTVVGVGYRRTGAAYHQLGVVVDAVEKEVDWPRGEVHWFASVVWYSPSRSENIWRHVSPFFQSQWDVRDLLVIDDETINPSILQALEGAYADWVYKHAASDFVAPAR